jgi:hypothetical protein
VIQPAYLAQLRRELRAELVITLVQIEQLVPGWWCSLSDLAEQLGTDRDSLNRNILKLAALGLLRRVSRGNSGGTWIWWVKRSADDQPNHLDAPRWRLRDQVGGRAQEIIVGQERAFASAKGIPFNTVRDFLAGHRPLLAKRWKLVSCPLQLADESEQLAA